MPWEEGNQFWMARSSHGRKPIFADADVLWDACVQYFEWVEANPLLEEKLFHYQGEVVKGTASKMRAMTVGGLCIYLDISKICWDNYCERDGFVSVTTRVREIIDNQKFAGAAADLLNPNIIARDLGLADKVDQKSTVNVTIDAIDAQLL